MEKNKNDDKKIIKETNKTVDSISNVLKNITENLDEKTKSKLNNIDEFTGLIKDKLHDSINEIDTEFKDKYLKVLAEMENLRKRFDNDRVDVLKYRASSFIQQILPTVDMFESALNAKNVSEEVKNWLLGFEMILNNFKTILENEGVKEIKAKVGDEFNPEFHMAIEQVESKQDSGTIVEIKNKGYLLYERLLRPVSVTVSKGPNKQKTEKEENKN